MANWTGNTPDDGDYWHSLTLLRRLIALVASKANRPPGAR